MVDGFEAGVGLAISENDVTECLERYGHAMSARDIGSILDCWEVPGLVLADDGATAFADDEQLQRFFTEVIDRYRAVGLMTTRPEIESVLSLTERIVLVGVRWPSFDDAGIERYSERSQYILRAGPDGRFKICVGIAEPMSDRVGQ